MEHVAMISSLLMLAALVGILKPYINGWSRKRFAGAAFAFFVVGIITVPKPTEAQLAAKAAKKASEDAAAAKAAIDRDAATITDKAKDAIGNVVEYRRSEFPKLLAKVGSQTFSQLADVERGGIYYAAESSADRPPLSGP